MCEVIGIEIHRMIAVPDMSDSWPTVSVQEVTVTGVPNTKHMSARGYIPISSIAPPPSSAFINRSTPCTSATAAQLHTSICRA